MGNKDLFSLSERKTNEILDELVRSPEKTLEILTGSINIGVTGNLALLTRLVNAAVNGSLLLQLRSEVNKLREQGKIEDTTFKQHDAQSLFLEVVKILDSEHLDEVRFNAIKNLFINSIATNDNDMSLVLGHQYLQLLKKLDSGDLILLKKIYELSFHDEYHGVSSYEEWLSIMTDDLSMPKELIQMYEKNLVNINIVKSKEESYKQGVYDNDFRLTELGKSLCEYILDIQQ